MRRKSSGLVQAALLKELNEVGSADDHHWVAILADLSICLVVNVGRRHEDAELAMPEPCYQSGDLAHAHAVARLVALGLQRELHSDGVSARANEVVANGIAATISPRTREVDPVHAWLARSPQICCEVLKTVR